jgi:hypothetical protein
VTPQQISKKVQEEADARFGEVIEHLLFLLERPPFCSKPFGLVWKWKQTGFLDGVNDDSLAQTLAEKFEEAALKLVGGRALEHPNDDEILDRFLDIRKETIAEYESHRNYCTNKFGM